eukprot:3402435-Amphidinium_carterae.1
MVQVCQQCKHSGNILRKGAAAHVTSRTIRIHAVKVSALGLHAAQMFRALQATLVHSNLGFRWSKVEGLSMVASATEHSARRGTSRPQSQVVNGVVALQGCYGFGGVPLQNNISRSWSLGLHMSCQQRTEQAALAILTTSIDLPPLPFII